MIIVNRKTSRRGSAPRIKGDSSSDVLDSSHYAEERQWMIDHMGIDLDLVRRDPAFWLGLTVGAHVDKMRADLGLNDV
jgi:hypothetical protein